MHARQARADEFIGLRRDVHRHPERAFEEHRTAASVADKLEAWGYAVERGIGGTGVVGTLVRGSGARRLGIRADMDTPPIDAASGAVRLMEDSLFERFPCDAVFAMHNMPGFAQGRRVLREGAAMASPDCASITLQGVGGHGAMPRRAADPIVAAASIIVALQTIVPRSIDPLHAAAVTVGALHAGKADNAIPASATLELSVRARDREVRATLERRIKALVAAQAESFGVKAQIDWKPGHAGLADTPAETAVAHDVATELVGAEQVTPQGPPLTGSAYWVLLAERFLTQR